MRVNKGGNDAGQRRVYQTGAMRPMPNVHFLTLPHSSIPRRHAMGVPVRPADGPAPARRAWGPQP